jgi:hypothetical protein
MIKDDPFRNLMCIFDWKFKNTDRVCIFLKAITCEVHFIIEEEPITGNHF